MVEETSSADIHHLATRSGEPTNVYRLQKRLGETPADRDKPGSPTPPFIIAIAISIALHRKFERLYHDVRLFTIPYDGQRPILGTMG